MSDFLLVASILAIIFSGLSLICSAINLALISALEQWNGFLAILWSMAWCQIIYDSAFYLSFDTNINNIADSVWDFMEGFGGLSVNLWTNVMAGVIVYIVWYRVTFDILGQFWALALIVYVPSLAVAVIEIVCSLTGHDRCVHIMAEFYYWIRIASILFNFFAFALIYSRVQAMKSMKKHPSSAEISIVVLSQRMMYYPMIQLLSRIFNAVYEQVFGFGPYKGESGTTTDRNQFILQCLACITQPAAGVGFLAVFLIFQPSAMKHFKSYFKRCRRATEEDSSSAPVIVSYNGDSANVILSPMRDPSTAYSRYDGNTVVEYPHIVGNGSFLDNSFHWKQDEELLRIIANDSVTKPSFNSNENSVF